MLDIRFIRENRDIVAKAIKDKKGKPVDIDLIIKLADERKVVQQNIEKVNQERNVAQAERNKDRGRELKEKLQQCEMELARVEKEFVALMIQIPNIPSPDTPVGPDEGSNKIIREWGEKPVFSFQPKEHFELGHALGVINTDKAAEVSGPRFAYLMGDLALMQFALVKLCMDVLTSEETLKSIAEKVGVSVSTKPFIPVIPPTIMKSAVMNRMARLQPIEERYFFEKDDLVFVGSAEHTLGALHMDQIIPERDLPIRYVGYSVAYRREAGTYGKDTKGILRQHQFDKVEMETFCMPEHSYQEQDFLVAIQEHIMRMLGIPYRVALLSTGEMGGPDHRQIDIECWMPGQGVYRETHSADLIQGYQARRLNTRVKRIDNSIEPVHMNDATVLAIGRTLIAIMENNQRADGSISIPEVLRTHVGKNEITKNN